jgi:hypothetical protein
MDANGWIYKGRQRDGRAELLHASAELLHASAELLHASARASDAVYTCMHTHILVLFLMYASSSLRRRMCLIHGGA